MNYGKFNNNGFTLLELLVTVAILAILATISITQFNEYRQRSYDAQSIHALHNLRDALLDYIMNEPEGHNFELYLSNTDIDNFESLPDKIKAKLGKLGTTSFGVYLEVVNSTQVGCRLSVGHCKGSGSYMIDGNLNSNYTYGKYACEDGKGFCIRPAAFVGVYTRPPCF